MVRFIILWQIPFLKRLMDLDSKQYESGNFLELCFISIWTVALELVSSLDSKVLRSPRICRWQTRCQACPRTNLDFWLYKLFILSDIFPGQAPTLPSTYETTADSARNPITKQFAWILNGSDKLQNFFTSTFLHEIFTNYTTWKIS